MQANRLALAAAAHGWPLTLASAACYESSRGGCGAPGARGGAAGPRVAGPEPGASRLRPGRRTVIKLIYCFRRRPDLTPAEFDAHWSRVHGAIGARIPGLRRLVQSRAVPVPGDDRPPDFDGVAELWFDDVDALLRARASEAWRAASLDEANFLDARSTAYVVTEERTIIESPAP